MAVINQQTTLQGLFKEVYDKGITDLYDFNAKLTKNIRFVPKEAHPGNLFHSPVDVLLENGISYSAAGVVPTFTGAGYLPPRAGQMLDATLAGAQLHGRVQISYEAMARSENAKARFKEAAAAVLARGLASVSKRNELQLLHGQLGYGVIAANPGTGATRTVTLTDETWSSGIWAGLSGPVVSGVGTGATIDIWAANLSAKVSVGSTFSNDPIVLIGVNASAKQLVFQVNNATDQTANWAGLNIFFETSSPSTEMVGLMSAAATTSASSPLFGINPNGYDLWQGNQLANVGTPSFSMVLQGQALAASYGISGKGVCIVPPKAYERMNTDQAAMRLYDVSYSAAKFENGAKALEFQTQTGPVEIMAHAFQKDGQAATFIPDDTARVGATDIRYIDRGGKEFLILESADAPATEARLISNQAFFCRRPRSLVLFTGLQY